MFKSVICCLFFIIGWCSEGIAQEFTGFFDFTYNEEKGSILLEVPNERLGQSFLYVNALSAGIGSNDLGLDRGQLGSDRIVKFIKAGNKILMIQPNQDYRAVSENELERKAVEEAFAQSVLWGFEISETKDEAVVIDLTPFLLEDAHGVSRRLQSAGEGTYKLEKSRSALWMDRTRAFPKNVEFEALLTFSGDPKGRWLRTVTPSPNAVTVRQHHSFIELPDSAYKPRQFHPYSGFNQLAYMDYATPIEEPITKRFIYRHRLEKKNPRAAISEAVEPIIYYIDPGCPEPIKSALMEGARWWDQAFQAAGYAQGTFQVKELPAGADMLDVRYNVIQWVHRSTRGWSYGASVSDPRTGEILKGHVSLGSLRVRQDYLIAQGLLSPFSESDTNHEEMKTLALARLRQLAAHEVGHTIGLSHNFASSTNNRASVMDYPHPYIEVSEDGHMDMSKAYEVGIGEWDKKAITYGYQDFPDDVNEDIQLNQMIRETQLAGLFFISDSDARPAAGAHPSAHLWDNGNDAANELLRLMEVRRSALDRMGEASVTSGTPLSELEKVLVPVYLLHRYQMEATSKLIGGLQYQYFVKGDAYEHLVKPVEQKDQDRALDVLLESLQPEALRLPQKIINSIPPPAQGYRRGRETFSGRTNLAFDPLSPAESYTNAVFGFILNQNRLSRIHRQGMTNLQMSSLGEWMDKISAQVFSRQGADVYDQSLIELVQYVYLSHLIHQAHASNSDSQIAAVLFYQMDQIVSKYLLPGGPLSPAQASYLTRLLKVAEDNPASLKMPVLMDLPPGSPIGCGGDDWLK